MSTALVGRRHYDGHPMSVCGICHHPAGDGYPVDGGVRGTICERCVDAVAAAILNHPLQMLSRGWPCLRRCTPAEQTAFRDGTYQHEFLRALSARNREAGNPEMPFFESWSLVESAEALLDLGPGARYRQMNAFAFALFIGTGLGEHAMRAFQGGGDGSQFALLASARALTCAIEPEIAKRAVRALFCAKVASPDVFPYVARLLYPA